MRGHGPPLLSADGLDVTQGNLKVVADASTGLVTATRVSDGATLLKQTGLEWGPTSTAKDRKGSVSAAVTFEDGCSAFVQGTTAHYLLCDSYAAQPGAWLLIHAAAGGTGSALVQVA